jgi:hypothetical protein
LRDGVWLFGEDITAQGVLAMPTIDTSIALQTATPDQWEQALYAFLAEKERRSGSLRTVQSYSRMLRHFVSALGKTPDRVTSPEVLS